MDKKLLAFVLSKAAVRKGLCCSCTKGLCRLCALALALARLQGGHQLRGCSVAKVAGSLVHHCNE